METVSCILCGNNDPHTIYTLPDYLLNRREVLYTFARCGHCGLIYQNPRPSHSEMVVHYPEDYDSFVDTNSSQLSWLLRQAHRYGVSKRNRFITRYKASGRLLDIGCATGTFLKGMHTMGNWSLWGVEINEYAARIASECRNLNIHLGTLKDAAYPSEFFDVVTLWDVIEHLHDPVAHLRESLRILKPDGILLIRLPDCMGWDAKCFGAYWAGLDPPRHLYAFSLDTLNSLLARAGFEPFNWDWSSAGYTTFLLSLRFMLAGRGRESPIGNSLLKILAHPLSRLLAVPVFWFPALARRGSHLVVTARKSTYHADQVRS